MIQTSVPQHINVVHQTKSSQCINLTRILLNFFVVLLLAAILIVLIIVPLRSIERIEELHHSSDENQVRIESIRQEREDQRQNLDQKMKQRHHEENLKQAEKFQYEQMLFNEQRRKDDFYILYQKQHSDNQQRQETLYMDFVDQLHGNNPTLNPIKLQKKVVELTRLFDRTYRSMLIQMLYRENLIKRTDFNNGTVFEAILNLRGANLNHLNLKPSDQENSYGDQVTSYVGLSLSSTNLINASLMDLDLSRSNFGRSNLFGCSLSRSNLANSNFFGANMTSCSLPNTMLRRSILSSATIENANFTGSTLSEVQLDYCFLDKSMFSYCNFNLVDFSYSSMLSTNFTRAVFKQARMVNTILEDADFSNIQANEIEFTGAHLSHSNFESAFLNQASFRSANLHDVNFENAVMYDVDLTNADLSNAKIDADQLKSALSIAGAQLPDGTVGINPNFLLSDRSHCNITRWIVEGNVTSTYYSNRENPCEFTANIVNSTMKISLNLTRYQRIIRRYPTKIYVAHSINKNESLTLNNIYIRFFDQSRNEIGARVSSEHADDYDDLLNLVSRFDCPTNTVEIELKFIFYDIDVTFSHVYVTIE